MSHRFATVIALMLLLIPGHSSAHNVRVFATVENSQIVGEGGLSGGNKVHNGKISILRKSDEQLLATRQTDENGRFDIGLTELGIEEPIDLIVVLDAGPGHRASWQIRAQDYLVEPAEQKDSTPPSTTAQPPSESPIPSYPPLRNIITGVICILGLGLLIAWARKRGGSS